MPVPTPCPDTFCVTVIPGFSQEHTLDFLKALAKGPSPHDAPTSHPPTCLHPLRIATTMNKHYNLNTTQIRLCKDQTHTTELSQERQSILSSKTSSGGRKSLSHCLAVPGNSREHHATGQRQARSPWQRGDSTISFYSP